MGNNNQGMDHAHALSYPEINTKTPLPFFDSLNAEVKDEVWGIIADTPPRRIAVKKWNQKRVVA